MRPWDHYRGLVEALDQVDLGGLALYDLADPIMEAFITGDHEAFRSYVQEVEALDICASEGQALAQALDHIEALKGHMGPDQAYYLAQARDLHHEALDLMEALRDHMEALDQALDHL